MFTVGLQTQRASRERGAVELSVPPRSLPGKDRVSPRGFQCSVFITRALGPDVKLRVKYFRDRT